MAWTSLLIALYAGSVFGDPEAASEPSDEGQRLHPVLEYISSAWNTLTRSTTNCEGVADTKLAESPVLYLPVDVVAPGSLIAPFGKLRNSCQTSPVLNPRGGTGSSAANRDPWIALPRESLRRPWGAIQRDVWLGQLLHHSWIAAGWKNRT